MVECEIASQPMAELNAAELELFLRYARAAAEQSATPMVQDGDDLTAQKRAGLLATVATERGTVIHFTGAGACLADRHGIDVMP